MGKSHIKGMAATKRLLRAIPDAVRDELASALDRGGMELARRILAKTPRKTGALQAGIKHRVLRRSLRLQVGLVGGKAARSRLFYGRILDRGRKAQTVTARRAGGSPYLMRIRGIAPKRFVTGSYPDLRAVIGRQLRGIWERALRRF